MNSLARINRHLKLTRQSYASREAPGTPPFLILFINSICNQSCEHCFYWRNLNRRDDLTFEELTALSEPIVELHPDTIKCCFQKIAAR